MSLLNAFASKSHVIKDSYRQELQIVTNIPIHHTYVRRAHLFVLFALHLPYSHVTYLIGPIIVAVRSLRG